MYAIRNNGVARDFMIQGRRYFMGRGVLKRTEDRDFAKAMINQRHVIVKGLDNIDDMKIGELRTRAKSLGLSLARGDKKVDIKAKILAVGSQ